MRDAIHKSFLIQSLTMTLNDKLPYWMEDSGVVIQQRRKKLTTQVYYRKHLRLEQMFSSMASSTHESAMSPKDYSQLADILLGDRLAFDILLKLKHCGRSNGHCHRDCCFDWLTFFLPALPA
ncbi:MAG: hypothetical protein GXY38_07865 [Planctomycetes bacterium]|nr:hypothetical protein [Planctomycetota bacterium]